MSFEYTRGRKRSGRWIDTKTNDIINGTELINRRDRDEMISSHRIRMLRYMIDGKTYHWSTYGGNGICYLNCEGGFAFNAEVKRMIRRGEITIGRTSGHEGCFGNMIRRTYATVTDKGREVYAKWKKRNT